MWITFSCLDWIEEVYITLGRSWLVYELDDRWVWLRGGFTAQRKIKDLLKFRKSCSL